eukprot:NODE_28_length_33831_cov_0.361200.p7 type:complete len:479 gc:universal NODE_28_length_33831_cov_0.361200:3088-1652(-)
MKVNTENGVVTVYEKVNTNRICIAFIHGMGGQSEQFKPIYNYLSNTFHVISVDLYGHGQSDDASSWDLKEIAKQYCKLLPRDKSYVFIAHSMGVGIAVYMYHEIKEHVKGMIWIGAKLSYDPNKMKAISSTPIWLINLWRRYHRIGGIYSQSVRQYIFYPAASAAIRQKQLKWNKESKTTTLLGLINEMKWPSESDFKSINVPVQLIVGEYDKITPIPSTISVFNTLINCKYLYTRQLAKSISLSKSTHPFPVVSISCAHNPMSEDVYNTVGQITHFFQHLKILVNPPSQSKEFKMDDPYALKNFKKWRAIQGVSKCIGSSLFRAMKILREIDDEHNPSLLFQNFKNIGLVVDMSRDTPPYHTEQFQPVPSSLLKYNRTTLKYVCKGDASRPMYIKQSFISKIPPQDEDVDYFVELCKEYWKMYPTKEIALHCHYGYNRTGFMIIAAMHKMGYVNHIMQGVNEFKENREPGIKYYEFM